ncbi:MAG: CapA family protein [Myxococcota bacterium]
MDVLLLRALLACAGSERVDEPDATEVPEASPVNADPAVRELASARMVFTGDFLPHGRVLQSAHDADVVEDGVSQNHGGFDVVFGGVADQVALADLAFLNLETPVAPAPRRGTWDMVFNAPPAVVTSLAAIGFDVVSFSNNHVYDQGRAAFVETMDRLDDASLAYVGAGRTCAEAYGPRWFELDGIRIAMFAGTEVLNDSLNRGDDEACVSVLEPDRVLAGVAQARADGADLVLVSIHWGVEYDTAPQERQIRIAHRLVDGGVDGIIGHHPHVLQPIEVYDAPDGRRGVIVYSLGNFVSNQSAWYEPGLHAADQGNPRDGVVLSMRAVKRRFGRGDHQVVRTELADIVATPMWTVNEDRDDQVVLRVVPTRARMATLDEALAQATADDDVVRLSRERTEMDTRWRIVGDILGRQFLW